MEDDFDVQNYQETVQRRPAYIERLEKALLGGIFGEEGAEGSENAGVLSDGLLQREDLFKIAPYLIAGQQGRAQPISYEDVYAEDGTTVIDQKPVYAEGVQPGDITGFGLETFGAQALSQDANNDGIPDFLGRYSPYFETAGASTTGGIESLRRGIGALGEGKTFFGPAAQYVSGGRGMYDPSQYVESYMNPYTENVIQETEKDIERQGNVARQRASAEAVGRGAFGGSRQGIQAAEVERSIMDAKSKASADLRARNYDQALAASSGAYQQAATRDLEAGRLMGGLGQSVGQLGTQYGNIAGQYGSLAGTSADIGRVYSALAPADLSFMSGVGAQERDYRQNMIDASRKEYMRPTEQALLPYSYAYGALGGTPSASVYSTQQSEYAPPTNPYVAGLGAYTTLQGINQAQ